MAVYCITYDLKSDNYNALIESIKVFGIWWHQSDSTWFIETIQNPKQILESLTRNLENGDKIMVIQVQKNWWAAGHNDEEYEWMKNRNF